MLGNVDVTFLAWNGRDGHDSSLGVGREVGAEGTDEGEPRPGRDNATHLGGHRECVSFFAYFDQGNLLFE